ncbi:MAG TPA: hypothetical protein VHK88_01230 [Aquihabitans sp.]|nr:hypothetical protein [Aquihabitans sp.]
MASKDLIELVDRYARRHEWTVFTGIPVTGPKAPGPFTTSANRTVTVALEQPGPASVRPFDRELFMAALAGSKATHLICARGYADRTVHGYLSTRRAYFEEAWQPTSPVRPVALVSEGRRESNMTAAYAAAGFNIEADGLPNNERRRGGGGAGRNDPWSNPKEGEDRLLHQLWERRDRRGWWLAEVPFGFSSSYKEAAARRIDTVVVEQREPRHSAGARDLDEFGAAVAGGAAIEIIEAKGTLNADVIGQLDCAFHLFRTSWPGNGELSLTACVGNVGDKAVQWYCKEHKIFVEPSSAT